jgi:hypothetical protein
MDWFHRLFSLHSQNRRNYLEVISGFELRINFGSQTSGCFGPQTSGRISDSEVPGSGDIRMNQQNPLATFGGIASCSFHQSWKKCKEGGGREGFWQGPGALAAWRELFAVSPRGISPGRCPYSDCFCRSSLRKNHFAVRMHGC